MANLQNKNTSLLAALCVSSNEVEIQGKTFTVYELESQMVGLLLLEMESAANAGVAVLSLLNPDSGESQQYFKSSWWKIGAAAQDVVFTLIAFSLQEIERDERGVPKAILDNVRRLPVGFIPPLLTAIAGANQSFFGELQGIWEKLQTTNPGIASALNAVLNPQSNEKQPENQAAGQSTSQPSNEAAGQL